MIHLATFRLLRRAVRVLNQRSAKKPSFRIDALFALATVAIVGGISDCVLAQRPETAASTGMDGFIEAYYSRDLAPAEPGLIASVNVEEGRMVRANEILASLDTSTQEASLAVAQKRAMARGEIESAEAEVKLYATKLQTIQQLRFAGNATQEEVDRAAADHAIALGKLKVAKEEFEVRQLEVIRVQRAIESMRIRSPIDGMVTRIFKHKGEYAAPGDPLVLQVMQISKLRATFSVRADVAARLALNQQVTVKTMNQSAVGTVEFVSSVIDPDSGTVRVRVQIDNSTGRYRVGARCSLEIDGVKPPRVSYRPRW